MSPDENLTSAEIIKRFNHFYDCWLDSITVTLKNISDYRVQGPFISICSGVHTLERDGKIGLDIEGYNDNPETFEDIAEADIYFIAENATWELGPLGVHCCEGT